MIFAPATRQGFSVSPRLAIRWAARRTGLTVRAIRYYEELGLISSHRGVRGSRTFGAAELDRLAEIAELRTVGLSLDEISGLLAADAPAGCPGVSQQLSALLNDHRQRLLHRLSCVDAIARRKGFTLIQDDRPSARDGREPAAHPEGADSPHA